MRPTAEVDRPSLAARFARILRPSHEHSVTSATFLIMMVTALASLLSLAREVYIAWAFGAGPNTDAFVAAFTFPDLANYLFSGGAASIAFTAMMARYQAEGREDAIEESLSVILTLLSVVMGVTLVIAAILVPRFTRFWFPQFGPQEFLMCVHMTRVVLPMQFFVVVGGVLRGVVAWRRQFLLPSLQPLILSASTILAAVFFARRFGIVSLAWGALLGSFVGALVVNVAGVRNLGLRYYPLFRFRHPAFREWLRLSLPLMLGATLLLVDDPFIRHFAAGVSGDITRISYAKRIFIVIVNIAAQASGLALMPHFAELFADKRMSEFHVAVGEALYRGSVFSLLVSGWLFVTALPLVDLIFRSLGGRFNFSDSVETASFLGLFAISLVFWTAQTIYTRAFLSAANTITPTIVTTIVAAMSYPIYAGMFRIFGVAGLPAASDIGIALIAVMLGALLSRNRMVPLRSIPWRALAVDTAVIVLATLIGVRISKVVALDGSRLRDVGSFSLTSAAWIATVLLGFYLTKSRFLVAANRMLRKLL